MAMKRFTPLALVLGAATGMSSRASAETLFQIDPFVAIVTGLKVDTIIQADNESREGRVSGMMLSDFGLRGTIGDLVSFESELMANGGTSLHGASAWEGQAALQVRKQIVRLTYASWMLEAGRIIDEASLNFVSSHVIDTLYQDTAVRDPLLYSGFNMGNGIHGTYEIVEGLRLGLTFTAGNPVATTASLQVGGAFTPFDRFYIQPYQAVQQSPATYPDDTFHIMLISPSILYASPFFEARAEFQQFFVDTNTNRTDDQNIKGFNARGDLRARLFDNLLVPFGNFSFERNDTVLGTDSTKLASDKYQSITLGGGVDLDLDHRANGRPSGLGVQYDLVQFQVGSGTVTRLHYFNLGATYWINDYTAVGLRGAIWLRAEEGTPHEGERSLIATLRAVL
jgi:hypothetical protein